MKHFIIVKFIKDYNWKENIKDIEKIFKETLNIDGVYNVNIKQSNSDRSNRYDLMIEMKLSKEGLLKYDASDPHKNWKDTYGQYIENKAIFDCD